MIVDFKGVYKKEANATAVVLLLIVLGINAISGRVAKKLEAPEVQRNRYCVVKKKKEVERVIEREEI